MTSVREFHLPDLGEGLTEAEIVRWLVAVGDSVTVDQPVVEVETAKAAVEVPTPFDGTVVATHGLPGEVIGVGSPLIAVSAQPATPVPPTGGLEPQPSGTVLVGYGTETMPRRHRGGSRPGGRTVASSPGPAQRRPGGPTPVISPLVRRLAREHGVDVAAITGSGPDGLVLRVDVERAISPAPVVPERTRPAGASEQPSRVSGVGEFDIPEGAERIPLRGPRRVVADKLARSRREIPDATTWVDVDATELLAARDALEHDAGPHVGVLALIARFVVAGLRRYPDLNSRVDTRAGQITRLPCVHLGVAAQTERALVVPVVRDAHALTTEQLAAEIRRLTEAARAGALTPAELTGGTFTVNNFGVFGVDGATPIINQPEAGMLGVGRIIARPWVVGGALCVRQVTQLSLTFDHRVCDGGTAGGFLRFVADCVEQPARLLRGL
jgi:pyruvate dehydrogenase E2 component (dihydrolipoamide acetyltransferase)